MTRPERLLRLVLRLLPRGMRDEHAEEIVDAAREEHRRARKRGRIARAAFWPRLATDTVRARWRARRPAIAAPRRRHSLGVAREVRYAIRSLRHTPGVSLIIVATLGAGIGLTTATFSVVNAVLIRQLPYRDADRLVYLTASLERDRIDDVRFSGLAFSHIRERATTLTDVAAVTILRQNLTGLDRAEQVQVGWTSGNFLSTLGAPPVLGRLLSDEDPPGTAVISDALWERSLGRRPDAIGRTVGLDGHAYTIVGVLPAGFRLHLPGTPPEIDIWKVPDDWWQNGNVWESPTGGGLRLVGHLGPDVTLEQANLEARQLAAGIRGRVPEYDENALTISVDTLQARVVGDVRTPLLLLLGSVGVVLLIACANVMNLLFVRAQGRQQEMAVRLALGSSRTHIVRSLLVESLVLATAGGSLGVLVATTAAPALRSLSVPLPRLASSGTDAAVLAFSAGVAILCTFLGGLAPAIRMARLPAGAALGITRATRGRAQQRVSQVLVVGQVALSLVLLIGAGLLGASLIRMQQIRPGFDANRLLTFAVSLPGTSYTWPEGTNRFLRRFEEALEHLPGVESAGVIWPLPLSGGQWLNEYVGGEVRAGDHVRARQHLVTPDYFETVRTPIVEGRGFAADDPKSVVVVSRRLAERAWPGASAVGRFIETNPWGGTRRMQVIGVAEDVRFRGLRDAPEEVIYLDAAGWSWTDWQVDMVVRTSVDPLSLVEPARAALAALDPNVPLARPREMTAYVADQLAPGRIALGMVGTFAMVAAALATIGMYGVLAHAVSMRRREIGIRLALGSAPAAIVGMVLRQGLWLTAIGAVIGLVSALWLTELLRAYLFDVEPTSIPTFALVTAGFTLVAMFACLIPARRALRIDPIQALKS